MGHRLAEVRPDLLYADQFKELKDYLFRFTFNSERKELLIEWCEATRVPLSQKLLKDVGGI